jgi:hypothetical protein
MSLLQQHTVQRLRDFRAGLLAIGDTDLSYKTMETFLVENRGAVDAVHAYNTIIHRLIPYQKISDIAILEAVRQEVVQIIDSQITASDAQEVVRPIFDDLILKVQETKLAALLNEFNASKEKQPNLAAIGLRTILCLVIQQRALLVRPTESLATRQDLALQPMLDDAIRLKIFSQAQTKLLDAYRRHGLKERSDNVAHKPGADNLVSKDDLSAAVNLLNGLLPELHESARRDAV